MDKPLQEAMNNLEVAGQLVLWVIELDMFDILYRPRIVIKAEALADFVAEFTVNEDNDEVPTPWVIQINGSSN